MSKIVIIGIIVVLLIATALGIITYCISEKSIEHVENIISEPDRVRIKMAEIEANQRINYFKVTKGRLPESIEEIEESQRPLRKLPKGKRYEYNATTGKISIVDDR